MLTERSYVTERRFTKSKTMLALAPLGRHKVAVVLSTEALPLSTNNSVAAWQTITKMHPVFCISADIHYSMHVYVNPFYPVPYGIPITSLMHLRERDCYHNLTIHGLDAVIKYTHQPPKSTTKTKSEYGEVESNSFIETVETFSEAAKGTKRKGANQYFSFMLSFSPLQFLRFS